VTSEAPPETPPEAQRTPPIPTFTGSSLIPGDDDSYVEIDEDGVPLGVWRWDPEEETWIFEEMPPLGDLPATGMLIGEEDGRGGPPSAIALALMLMLMLLGAGLRARGIKADGISKKSRTGL
jgi:hypothetical protein